MKNQSNDINFLRIVEDLVYDKGLSKEKVLAVICEAVANIYQQKYPGDVFIVTVDSAKAGSLLVYRKIDESDCCSKESFSVKSPCCFKPFDKPLTRRDIVSSKDFISLAIKRLEQENIYNVYKDRVGELITGTISKVEESGFIVNLGDTIAFLPKSLSGKNASFAAGSMVKALIKTVLSFAERGHQITLDRSTSNFVVKLFAIEVPEVFEGLIEIVAADRIPGFKTKMIVKAKAKNIDPVGSCIGIGGCRIKPIRLELGNEIVDIIAWNEDKEILIKKVIASSKVSKEVSIEDPEEWISKVSILPHKKDLQLSDAGYVDGDIRQIAIVHVRPGKKAFFVGKEGSNIKLTSKLLNMKIDVVEDSQ